MGTPMLSGESTCLHIGQFTIIECTMQGNNIGLHNILRVLKLLFANVNPA